MTDTVSYSEMLESLKGIKGDAKESRFLYGAFNGKPPGKVDPSPEGNLIGGANTPIFNEKIADGFVEIAKFYSLNQESETYAMTANLRTGGSVFTLFKDGFMVTRFYARFPDEGLPKDGTPT